MEKNKESLTADRFQMCKWRNKSKNISHRQDVLSLFLARPSQYSCAVSGIHKAPACLPDQANSLHSVLLGLAQCSPPTEHFHLSKRCLSAIHNAEEASKPSLECHWSRRHPLGQREYMCQISKCYKSRALSQFDPLHSHGN